MSTIGPHDLLQIGQRVSVGSQFGTVKSAEYVPASNGGMICLHTIQFTERRVFHRLKSGAVSHKREPIKPVTRTVNYSHIVI